MISEFSITYSGWWIVAVIFTGLLYASLLYFKNPLSRFSKRVLIFLFFLRFLSVAILAFLLLSPFIKRKIKTEEKPVIVVGIDNSKSMVLTPDSLFYKDKFPRKVEELISSLKENYKTDVYLFGEGVKPYKTPDFSDGFSDYSEFLKYVKKDYRGVNVGAIVLAGDGIYNKGTDPVYEASSLSWPVYTIVTGDTNTYADLKINDVRYNEIVYLDDDFPVEINVLAKKLSGKKARIKVSAFGKSIMNKQFFINKDLFEKTFRVMIPAEIKGKHGVKIELIPLKNEFNKNNNREKIYVEVLDTKKKILIVASAPHPDIGSIGRSLEKYKNYQIDVRFAYNLDVSPEDYNLVILHQLPSKKYGISKFIKKLKQNKIPLLFVLGQKTDIESFNKISRGMEIKSIHGFENSQAVINPLFTLFLYDKKMADILENLPPLTVPFGNYITPAFSQTFAYQKINNIETDIPLILFYNQESTKYGVVSGEGLWLWRLHNYLQSQNFDATDALIGKSVQYLLAREDKRHFKVQCGDSFYPGDDIVFKAMLYNDSWELVNESEIDLLLIDEQGNKFRYKFNKYEDYYLLHINNLGSGVYKYSASVKYGNQKYSDNGEFVVKSVTVESSNLKADDKVMFEIARKTSGKMFYLKDINKLPETIVKSENVKTKVIYVYKTENVINIFWILLLILSLLFLEWFLRKYYGSY